MMILDYTTEHTRAVVRAPFPTVEERETWLNNNCGRCANGVGGFCALVAVALFGRTPVQWDETSPDLPAYRYTCCEWRSR